MVEETILTSDLKGQFLCFFLVGGQKIRVTSFSQMHQVKHIPDESECVTISLNFETLAMLVKVCCDANMQNVCNDCESMSHLNPLLILKAPQLIISSTLFTACVQSVSLSFFFVFNNLCEVLPLS